MKDNIVKTKRHCPGEDYEINIFVCRGRQKVHYPKCSACDFKNQTVDISETLTTEKRLHTAPLPARKQKKTGVIMIKSKPSAAKICIDGEDIGVTPAIVSKLVPGSYEVEIYKDGYDTWKQSVEVEAYKEKTITAVLQGMNGSIAIDSEPANAKIFIDGKEIGVTPGTIVDIKPGKYMIEVKLDGYEVWSQSVIVEAEKETQLTPELVEKYGSLFLGSKPSKAIVFLDGKEIGITPVSLRTVAVGMHLVEVRKGGYDVWRKNVNVKPGKKKTISAILNKAAGSVIIKSKPKNAKIYVDGKYAGTTPERIKSVIPGTHEVKIMMDGYEDWSETVNIDAGKERVLAAILQRITGTVMIESEPSKARIYLDGKEIGVTPEIIMSGDPGTHLVEVRMDGYEDWSERVSIKPGKENTLTAILQVKTGSIRVDSEPSGAYIYINGKEAGRTPETIKKLMPSMYLVEIKRDGYEEWCERVDVPSGEELPLTAELRAKPGIVFISSEPSGAMVYIDDREAGTAPVTVSKLGIGIHQVEVKLDRYKDWNKSVKIDPGGELSLTADLQMKPGTIVINSEPAQAKVYLGSKKVGTTPSTITGLKPGEYTVEIRREGYEEWSGRAEVMPGEECVLTAELSIKVGGVNVKSEPSNAQIYLDGKETGRTPWVIDDLKPGEYTIEVRLEGYEARSERVSIKPGKENTLTAILQVKTGSIRVDSEPSGAYIYINGKESGRTPETIKKLIPSTYLIGIKRDGYEEWCERVDVTSGEEMSLTAELRAKPGIAFINSEPSGAMVYIDDGEAGVTPVTVPKLGIGIHQVEVKLEGYKNWSKSVEIDPGRELSLTAELQTKPGSVQISSEPSGAIIFVDGKKKATTPETLMELSPGTYQIELKLQGYEEWSERLEVMPGEECVLTAELSVKKGIVSVRSNPTNAQIYLDGEESGKTPGEITNLKAGEYTIEVKLEGYEDWREMVEVSPGKEASLAAELRAKPGTVNVGSEPSGAIVYIDGKEAGTTPATLKEVSSGTHLVEVSLEGYEGWSESVKVTHDKEMVVTAVFREKAGEINVQSEPAKATIYLDGREVGITPETLRSVPVGFHEIEVRMEGHEDWKKAVNVKNGKEISLNAALRLNTGSVLIKSEPENAIIFLDGKEACETPGNLTAIPVGVHEVEVRKEGYVSWKKMMKVKAGKERDLTVVLERMKGSLVINSEPSQAKIYVGGKKVGTTPATLTDLRPGEYTVEIRREGYKEWRGRAEVMPGEECVLTAELSIKAGSVNVKSEPSNAQIYLDGKETGRTPVAIDDLKPGEYTIEVRLDGYEDWREMVEMSPGKEVSLTAELCAKPGTVNVSSEPSGAIVYIDGKEAGTTPATLKEVSSGTHLVEVRLEGYEGWSESVKVTHDKEMVVTAVFREITGTVNVQSEPAKATIYLDGREVGITPETLRSVPVGFHEIEVRMEGHEDWKKAVNVKNGKEISLNAALRLNTGSVLIKSEPENAIIFLDGKEVGETPGNLTAIPIGVHEVEVRKEGYVAWKKTLKVKAGKERDLTAVLERMKGSLVINSEPAQAKIYVGGKKVGTTPATITDLRPGEYTVEIRREGYKEWRGRAEVMPGEECVLTAALSIKAGSVNVKSEPSNAQIYLDGKETGRTPWVIDDLKPGEYTIEVRLEGYEEWCERVDVSSGEEMSLTAELRARAGTVINGSESSGATVYSDKVSEKAPSRDKNEHKQEVEAVEDKIEAISSKSQSNPGSFGIKDKIPLEGVVKLRSSYSKVAVSQIDSLPIISIRERNNNIFFCHSTISHSYEAKPIYDGDVVIDHSTGLMWHQSGSSEYFNLKKANKWLKKLNKMNYAGFNDWRLPTVEEALSLLEFNANDGNFVDPVFDKKQWGIWTGDKDGWSYVWVVTFVIGTVSLNHAGSAAAFVRPVRSLDTVSSA